FGRLLGAVNPVAGLIGTALLTGIGDFLKSEVGGTLSDPTYDSLVPDTAIEQAGDDIDSFMAAQFDQAFATLQDDAAHYYSNFGLPQPLSTAQSRCSGQDSISADLKQSNALKTAYNNAAYQQLVPRLFTWESTTFNSDSPLTYFRGFQPDNQVTVSFE